MTFTAPIAYREEPGGLRRIVPVAYRLRHGHEYGFSLGDYDVTRSSSSIPSFNPPSWGSADDWAGALAIHPATGDVYVADGTLSTTFPGTPGGAYGSPFAGGGYVSRFNSTLTSLLQSTFSIHAFAIAIHPVTGDVYVGGAAGAFPGTTGGAQPSYGGGGRDGFVARFNSTLTSLRQATFLGGSDLDHVTGLAIHPTTGDVYVAGDTNSRNFPGTSGGAQTSFGGAVLTNVFVARLNSALTSLMQSTFLGGDPAPGHFTGYNNARGLAIHPTTGDVYVAGETYSPTFPGTTGGAQGPQATLSGEAQDGFVARFNSALTSLLQSTYLSYPRTAPNAFSPFYLYALAIHPTTGDVYTAGWAAGWSSLSRLNGALTVLLHSTQANGHVTPRALAIHPMTGDVYVAGETGSDLPGTTGGAQATYGGGGSDGFVARFDSALASLRQATFLGGSGLDAADALAIHRTTGDVYVAGQTRSPTFPGTTGGAQPSPAGSYDVFVARLTADLSLTGPGPLPLGGGRPACESVGTGGLPGHGVRDHHQCGRGDGHERRHLAPDRDPRELRVSDDGSADECRDGHAEYPRGYPAGTRPDLRDRADADGALRADRRGLRVRGGEHGAGGDAGRHQHLVALGVSDARA